MPVSPNFAREVTATLVRLGISQHEAVVRTHLRPLTISNMCLGRIPSATTIMQYSSRLGINPETLLEMAGYPVVHLPQPMTAGQEINNSTRDEYSFQTIQLMGAKMPAPENYPLPAEKYIQTDFCLRISGESMTPLLQNGDIVGIKAQCGADSGQLIAARYEEKLTLAQWLLRDEKWYLVPSNPLFTAIPIDPAVTNMAILGVVVWHIHDSSRH